MKTNLYIYMCVCVCVCVYVCMYIKKNRKEKENLIFFFTSHITCKHNPLHMVCVGNFSTYKVILD